jgi:hypothetical protein
MSGLLIVKWHGSPWCRPLQTFDRDFALLFLPNEEAEEEEATAESHQHKQDDPPGITSKKIHQDPAGVGAGAGGRD